VGFGVDLLQGFRARLDGLGPEDRGSFGEEEIQGEEKGQKEEEAAQLPHALILAPGSGKRVAPGTFGT
jgi:hypothetical protein